MGIFRQVSRPTYDDAAREQVTAARDATRDLHALQSFAARGRHLDRGLDPVGGEFHRPLAAVVLAGGASPNGPRQGHHAAPGGATTMVEHTVEVLRGRCDPVCVIAAPGQPLPALQAEVLRDDIRGVGPLLATGRGLRAAARGPGSRLHQRGRHALSVGGPTSTSWWPTTMPTSISSFRGTAATTTWPGSTAPG